MQPPIQAQVREVPRQQRQSRPRCPPAPRWPPARAIFSPSPTGARSWYSRAKAGQLPLGQQRRQPAAQRPRTAADPAAPRRSARMAGPRPARAPSPRGARPGGRPAARWRSDEAAAWACIPRATQRAASMQCPSDSRALCAQQARRYSPRRLSILQESTPTMNFSFVSGDAAAGRRRPARHPPSSMASSETPPPLPGGRGQGPGRQAARRRHPGGLQGQGGADLRAAHPGQARRRARAAAGRWARARSSTPRCSAWPPAARRRRPRSSRRRS